MTKKIEKKPVFNALYENGVCYAVCIATKSFINREVTSFSKDYFVIINKCDEKRVKEFIFYPTEGYKQLCEKSLTPDEIEIFKRDRTRFERVLSNENGQIYEQKDQSFKKGYNKIRKKIKN